MYSFTDNKKTVDIQPYLRRISDLTTPNLALSGTEGSRSESRQNRTIPVLLCPLDDGQVLQDESIWAVTCDICDRGVCVVLSQPFLAELIVVGLQFCEDGSEPCFFIGEGRQTHPIGAGFWKLGIELTEFANDSDQYDLEQLHSLARQLLPSASP